MNVQDITVDLSKKNIKPESIVLRQGDKSGTTLRVKVLDNGVNVSSLSGYTAKFIMKLPYNRFYYEVEGTINGSMLTFVIDESYAAVQSGVTNIAYVALVNGETTKMSANNIRVEILPSALDGFTSPPEWTDPIDEFIEEQTERVDEVVTRATEAAEAAEGIVMDDIPLMSANIRGGAKLGAGLVIVNGALELDGSGDIATAVDAWLAEHPEATTTVQDGAVTTAKLANGAVTDDKLVQSGGVLETVNDINTEVQDIRTGADGIIYASSGEAVRSQFNNVGENIEMIQDAYGEQNVVLSDDVNASYVIDGDEVEITISGISLFSSNTPVYTNANIEGFYVSGLNTLSNVLGIVIGKDASGNYYFFTAASNTVGQIFRVTPQGSYTRVIDASISGSNFKKVLINSFNNGILSLSVYNIYDDLVTTQTRDLSSFNLTSVNVGFIPYNSNANVIRVPFSSFGLLYKQFLEPTILDKLLPMLVNQTKTYKIKLIGDSITAGYGGTGFDASSTGGGEQIIGDVYQNVNGVCWANSLKSYLETKFAGVTVINNGYRGATAEFLYNNIGSFVSNDDDLVICMIGTNNRNNSGDLNRLYTNLQNIVTYVQGLNASIVLMSCIPASLTNEQNMSVLHMEDVNMIIGAIARINVVPWISVYNLMREYLKYTDTTLDSLLVDGLHPNDDGYGVMYQLISNALGFTTPIDEYAWTPSVISKA